MRNSNIECLRLLAMLCITLNHFPFPNEQIMAKGDMVLIGVTSLLQCFGGLGDCLFFIITSWFLCLEKPNLKQSLKRAWILERQLLFYSIFLFVIYVICFVNHLYNVSTKDFIKSVLSAFFPFATSHWWFPTSYMLFLIIFPFLSTALKALDKKMHGILVCILILLYSFVPFGLNIIKLNMGYSIVLFLYLYIITSFIRWYTPDLINRQLAKKMILLGLFSGVLIQVITLVSIRYIIGVDTLLVFGWLNCPTCFPSLLMAIGLIVYADTCVPTHSKIVNKLASSTLAVYLVLTDENINILLKKLIEQLNLDSWFLLLMCLIISTVFYCFILLFDFVRQFFFHITIDKRKGCSFERAYQHAYKSFSFLHNRFEMLLNGAKS